MDDGPRAINYTPLDWLVLFYPQTTVRWIGRLIPGKFKHVSLAGFVPTANAWVFYSVDPFGCPIEVWPGDRAGSLRFQEVTCWGQPNGATIVRFPNAEKRSSWLRAGWWCVPAAKHALGVRSGALWPDQLYRYLIANGGEIVLGHDAENSTGRSADRGGSKTG